MGDSNKRGHVWYSVTDRPIVYRLFRGVRQPEFSVAAKDILPKLEIPMLLVWGEKDRMVPIELASEFANMSDRIELVRLPNQGHCPHDENPTLFNQILLEWLGHLPD